MESSFGNLLSLTTRNKETGNWFTPYMPRMYISVDFAIDTFQIPRIYREFSIFKWKSAVCTIFHWNMKQIVSLNLNQSRKINPNSLGKYKLIYAKCKALALKIELQNIKIKYDFRIKCLLFNKKETSLLRDNFLKQYLYCWIDIEYPCAYLWHAKNPIRWKIFTLRWKSFIFYAVVVAGPF